MIFIIIVSYVMWEVKMQRKAEGRAMKARGNVQVEAEGGMCRTPHQA